MKTVIKAALFAAAASIAATTLMPPAFAAVGVSVNFGDVSIGYRDGYYDKHHHWHHWRHDNDWQSYRDAHPEHYRDYGHDQDRDQDHPH